jgi:ADP-ribosylglycohydrolase
MANITTKVNAAIDPEARSQYWDSATYLNDAAGAIAVGDIFQVETSLGKAAKKMKIITTGGAMSFRRNSQFTMYPEATWRDNNVGLRYQVLNSGVTSTDTTMNAIVVASGATYEFSGGYIANIEIVTKTGSFTLEVS